MGWRCARGLGGLVLLGGLAAAGSLAGCADPALDRMAEVRVEVCACRDAACVDAALKQLPAQAPRELPPAQRLAAEIVSCVAKVAAMEPEDVDATPAAEPATPTAPATPAAPAAPTTK